MNQKQICLKCKHFCERFACKKASLKYGTDGYGPWHGSAACIHDPFNSVLPDLFEAATEENFGALRIEISKLKDDLYKANYKIKNLTTGIAERIANGIEPASGEE